MKNDLIPGRYSNFISVEGVFIDKYRAHAESLGISKEEIDKTIAKMNSHKESYIKMSFKKNESKSATEDHIMKFKEARKEFRRVAKLLKSSSGYKSSIGEDLGIIGTEAAELETSEMKPVLKTFYSGNNVHIKFYKYRTDGIMVFSRREDEKEFTLLGYGATSPYIDTRENLDPLKPESREYYAFYIRKFKAIGVKSDTALVTIPMRA